jgi:hypothetical protein
MRGGAGGHPISTNEAIFSKHGNKGFRVARNGEYRLARLDNEQT